ncbi:MAG: hypothetical protein KJ833_08105, partial [Alphaproteobacteria bacterium]|nr:hypothetical protein [Alphaproteobacteria bacterium]
QIIMIQPFAQRQIHLTVNPATKAGFFYARKYQKEGTMNLKCFSLMRLWCKFWRFVSLIDDAQLLFCGGCGGKH